MSNRRKCAHNCLSESLARDTTVYTVQNSKLAKAAVEGGSAGEFGEGLPDLRGTVGDRDTV